MSADSAIADVLLPLALDGAYSYRIPAGMGLGLGDFVAVPLGPRQMIGVVWALKDQALTNKALSPVGLVAISSIVGVDLCAPDGQ